MSFGKDKPPPPKKKKTWNYLLESGPHVVRASRAR